MKAITYIGKDKFLIKRYIPDHIQINLHVISDVELVSSNLAQASIIIIETDAVQTIDFQQLKALKCQFPSCPVILVSDGASEIQLRKAYRARIRDYIVLPDDSEYFSILIEQLIKYQTNDNDSREFHIIDLSCRTEIAKTNRKPKTSKAVEFIKNNYHTKLSVNDLAKMCHMQVSSFSRKFREEHGCTIRDYIKNLRINSAMRLLKKTQLSIESIAFDVGFETVSLFNRLFKQIAGVCPSIYRQNFSRAYM